MSTDHVGTILYVHGVRFFFFSLCLYVCLAGLLSTHVVKLRSRKQEKLDIITTSELLNLH